MKTDVKCVSVAVAAFALLGAPVLAHADAQSGGGRGGGAGKPPVSSPPVTSPGVRIPQGDRDRIRDRDRVDVPDQDRDRDRDRDRVDVPDQDRIRDRDQDRDYLYLGTQDRLRTYDRDGDGNIDRTEFTQWHEGAFRACDADSDGTCTMREFQAVRLGPGPASGSPAAQHQRMEERAQLRKTERFRAMDGNGDGVVSRNEYMKFGELNYLDADTNDDGKLSYKELQQFHRGE